MSRLSRKFVAVLMLLWLPLFSGNALAASVVMQMPAAHCHDDAMQMADMDMGDMDMSAHHMSDAADEHTPACNTCGVCHLACNGYLGVPGLGVIAVQTTARDITPYLVVFHSYTSAPLLPPPLARA